MARIQLKSNQVLIVDEEEAKRVSGLVAEAKDRLVKEGTNLSQTPITISHQDGFWIGSANDYSQTFFESKDKVFINSFKNKEKLEEFHRTYGYFDHREEFIEGYGIVDVPMQFLIATGQIQLVDNGFYKEVVNLPLEAEKKRKWNELWEIYLLNLTGKELTSYNLHGNQPRKPDNK